MFDTPDMQLYLKHKQFITLEQGFGWFLLSQTCPITKLLKEKRENTVVLQMDK